ncbi:MAG: hypothetical protein LBO63_01515 [Oscillospiraceae bacterium]|nr:hypothetical protein [Oscillospiraceae bacterium]
MKKTLIIVIATLFCLSVLGSCDKTKATRETDTETPKTTITENSTESETPLLSAGKKVYSIFTSEEELNQAFISGRFKGIEELTESCGYFKPAQMNENDPFLRVTVVDGSYVLFEWDVEEIRYNDIDYADFEKTFEWIPIEKTGDLQWYQRTSGTPELYEWRGEYLVYTNDETQRLWVIWEEQGYVFRSYVPDFWSWEQVKAFCTAQWVPVTQLG